MMRKVKYKLPGITIAIILLNISIGILVLIITRSLLLPSGLIISSLLLSIPIACYSRDNRILRSRLEAIFEQEENEHAAKDRFIANAYHELRASYSSTFAIVNILYKAGTKAELERVIGNLKTTFQISKNIMDNILEFEKGNAGINGAAYIDEVGMRSLVQNIVETYQYAADENGITLTAVFSEDFPEYIHTDKIKINQMIANLLSNAIKFARDNTIVFIRVCLEGYDNWQLCVENEGGGIPTDNLDRIFEAFWTSNPRGIGLGLYIVRKLAASLEGKVSVTSDPDHGTKFAVTLPLLPSHLQTLDSD